MSLILQSLYFFLPAYIANMAPVFARKWKFLNKPISVKYFGKHKTWRGILVATAAGLVTFILQQQFYTPSLWIIDYTDFPFYFGAFMGLGAILGDLVKSYYKRKAEIKEGEPWHVFDQLDFVFGGIIGSFVVWVPPMRVVLVLLIASPILHVIVNYIGHKIGMRKRWI